MERSPANLTTLEARITSLERRLFRQRLLMGGMGAVACAALLMGQASPPPTEPPGELIVRRLQVVTERGTRVVDLGSTTRGPYIDLKDTEGRPLISLAAVHGEGASLTVTDGRGIERVRLRGKDDATLTLFDSQARERLKLSAADGSTEVNIADNRGAPRLFVRSSDRSGTELAVSGPEMVERAALRVDGAGRPTLSLNQPMGQLTATIGAGLAGTWGARFDKGGRVGTIDLMIDPDGAPRVLLTHAQERRLALGTTHRDKSGGPTRTAPSSVLLFDNTGKVIWEAP
jgi:hypothetical protein